MPRRAPRLLPGLHAEPGSTGSEASVEGEDGSSTEVGSDGSEGVLSSLGSDSTAGHHHHRQQHRELKEKQPSRGWSLGYCSRAPPRHGPSTKARDQPMPQSVGAKRNLQWYRRILGLFPKARWALPGPLFKRSVEGALVVVTQEEGDLRETHRVVGQYRFAISLRTVSRIS